MNGRPTTRVVILLLAGVVLVAAGCTRPKPQAPEQIVEPEIVVPTLQLTPGQTVVSARDIPTLAWSPTPEVPVVALPTTPPTATPTPTEGPSPVPTVPVSALPPTAVPPTSAAAPAPTSVPPQPTQPPVSTGSYMVQRGDTLFSIGQRFGVPWREIADANGIGAPYEIVSGQTLTIPQAGSSSSGPAPTSATGTTPRTHVVEAGENLYRIGLKYGLPWQTIAEANGITDPTQVYVGQQLVIP
jgi:LysM repeat protein